jgi:hypothetical protein
MPSTFPEIKYTASPAQKLFRVSISEPTPHHGSHTYTYTYPHPTQHQHAQPRRNSAGDAVPEISQNWFKARKASASPEIKSSGHGHSDAEASKMRAKSVDAGRRWEVDHGRGYGERKKSSGFWGKVTGPGSGGRVIN